MLVGTDVNRRRTAYWDKQAARYDRAMDFWDRHLFGDSRPTFTGLVGHTYGFFSVAADNVGNAQTLPTTSQATTTIHLQTTPILTVTDNGGTYNDGAFEASAASARARRPSSFMVKWRSSRVAWMRSSGSFMRSGRAALNSS